jgi:lysophospholipase L1-like esterase
MSSPQNSPRPRQLAPRRVCSALLLILLTALTTASATLPKKKRPVPTATQKHTIPHHLKTRTKTASAKPHNRLTAATHRREIIPPTHSYAVSNIPASDYTAGPVQPTGSPFLYASNLNPVFEALKTLEAAKTSGTTPDEMATIRILQFGDSHTAADLFTGAVRASLQAQFGDGGLGYQFPGHPFAGYHLAGSSRSQTSGWVTEGNKFTQLGDGDLGLGGISISTSRPDESIELSTSCTTFQLHYLRQLEGGRLRFTDNGVTISDIDTSITPTQSTDTETRGPGTFTYACTPGVHDFTLTTLDRAPVRLLGLVTEQPGVTYECLGINGAIAPLMLRWNQEIFAQYLRQRNPNLIVLAYGTNEAAESPSSNADYVEKFDQLLDNLHRYVPTAAILVLGPYDRATSHTVRVGRRRKVFWSTFAGTSRIIADQEAACRTHHCAYYNEQTRMGGPGSMLHWAAAGLAQADHTHLTGTGYRELGQALYADFLNAYKTYQQTTQTSQIR